MNHRVYISGLGMITSIGHSGMEVSESLRNMRHGFEVYPPFEEEKAPVKLVGTIKGFSVDSLDFEDWTFPPEYLIRREYLRSLPPHGVYVFCAMQQCLEQSGLPPELVSHHRTGLYASSGGSPRLLFHNMERMNHYGVMRCAPTGIIAAIAGTLNFNLVAAHRILGSSCGFSSACASSGHALGMAFDEIRSGQQDRMFVAAGEDCNRESILPFAGMRALSTSADPQTASCPFDVARNGFVATGGGVVLLLESEKSLEERGGTALAEMVGWGQSSDGHNVAISHPEGHGLARAMESALLRSNLSAGEIGYINAHATSTPIGDASELKALHEVFPTADCQPTISSTKALTGHALSMASLLEASICILAIQHRFIPGSAHLRQPDPICGDLRITRETIDADPGTVLSNSSGFGGANVSLIFRAPPQGKSGSILS